jgi:hypothetical protein
MRRIYGVDEWYANLSQEEQEAIDKIDRLRLRQEKIEKAIERSLFQKGLIKKIA